MLPRVCVQGRAVGGCESKILLGSSLGNAALCGVLGLHTPCVDVLICHVSVVDQFYYSRNRNQRESVVSCITRAAFFSRSMRCKLVSTLAVQRSLGVIVFFVPAL